MQLDAVRRLDPPRVVASRHPFEAAAGNLASTQSAKAPNLDPRVAEEIGTRRPSALEFVEEVGNDALPVGSLQRDHGERDPELSGDGAGVTEVLLPRALAEMRELVLEPDLQVEGVHVVTRLRQRGEGDRAVHPSRREHGDAHTDRIPQGNHDARNGGRIPPGCRGAPPRSQDHPWQNQPPTTGAAASLPSGPREPAVNP